MRATFYKHLLKPLLFRLDPETAHHLAMAVLTNAPRALLEMFSAHLREPQLEREVFGLKFPNPIGLAAGFDKNAVALPAWEALGFGFVEAGTITAHPQPGNPKPRIFRFPENEALINRMGFNNDGTDAVAMRLRKLRVSGRWPGIPVGLNIGKSKITPLAEATGDYLASFEKLFSLGDYFALNVSSPNTPGLRELQGKAALDELLGSVQRKNAELSAAAAETPPLAPDSGKTAPRHLKPVLVKIAPDLEFVQIEEILELVERHTLAGVVATNTTLDHSSVAESKRQQGGLSGRPLQQRSTEIVRFISSRTTKPVIAVGGIFDANGAREKFDAGASLIQLYTGFVYRGPALIGEICEALVR